MSSSIRQYRDTWQIEQVEHLIKLIEEQAINSQDQIELKLGFNGEDSTWITLPDAAQVLSTLKDAAAALRAIRQMVIHTVEVKDSPPVAE